MFDMDSEKPPFLSFLEMFIFLVLIKNWSYCSFFMWDFVLAAKLASFCTYVEMI